MENTTTHTKPTTKKPQYTPVVNLTDSQKELFEQLIAVENDHKDWDLLAAESNVIIHKKRVSQKGMVMPLKLHAVFPEISFEVLAEMIIEPSVRRQWDHVEGFDIIDVLATNEDIIYTYIKVSYSIFGPFLTFLESFPNGWSQRLPPEEDYRQRIPRREHSNDRVSECRA